MPNSRKRIALLVETSLGSGREILRGIARYARQCGDWQLFHAAGGLHDPPPDWINYWDGDGVIARIQNKAMLEELVSLRVPVVDVLGVCENRFPLVHVNDEAIAEIAAAHFKERNFRHFAFYGIKGENWSERRALGFKNACRDSGTFHILETARKPADHADERFSQVQQWIASLPKPVAIMVCSDQRGLELLEACLSENIPVPEQVAVVGVDNDTALCEISDPPLTSVRGGHSNVGFESAALLDRLIAGDVSPPDPLLVPPNGIVIRESSDIQAISDPVIAKGIHYIRERLSEPITNDTIARAAGVSRTLFQKRFREETGQSIRTYILERRVERAISLIESTDIPLIEVAERTGFRHQEYLGQVVKRATGLTPGILRKKSERA
ncbi:MAG: XylR family transcriptional regulator [Verrucomicrobiales bacterium]|nr:XylR family transcriptional regulator [Verrucomicrobiales bacterium]